MSYQRADGDIGSHIIVKLDDGYYIAWSSICDAPLTYRMREAEVRRHMRAANERSRTPDFERRWKRLQEFGTTDMIHDSAERTVLVNRAGPNEECLTLDALKRMYESDTARKKFQLTIDDIEVFVKDRILEGETVESARKEMEENLPRNPHRKLHYEALIRALTTAENHQ